MISHCHLLSYLPISALLYSYSKFYLFLVTGMPIVPIRQTSLSISAHTILVINVISSYRVILFLFFSRGRLEVGRWERIVIYRRKCCAMLWRFIDEYGSIYLSFFPPPSLPLSLPLVYLFSPTLFSYKKQLLQLLFKFPICAFFDGLVNDFWPLEETCHHDRSVVTKIFHLQRHHVSHTLWYPIDVDPCLSCPTTDPAFAQIQNLWLKSRQNSLVITT